MTKRPEAEHEQVRRQRFGAAMQKTRRSSGFSGEVLGEIVGAPQSTISSWERGESEPPYRAVFAVEAACGQPPGSLSSMLGYVPVGTEPAGDVELAIKACPMLNADERIVLLALFRLLAFR